MIVFATPLYYWNMSGQSRTVIDRLLALEEGDGNLLRGYGRASALRNTAKRNTFQTVPIRKREAGTVAGSKHFLACFSKPAPNDRADCVKHIATRQMKGGHNFCLAWFFFVPLSSHHFRTGRTELNTRKGVTLIGDKWKVLILRDLLTGTKRFGELKKSIGSVSQKVLTAQLRTMEASGLVSRKVYAEVPPRVEYSLTELGQSLSPILDAMRNWGEGYKASFI